MGQPETRICVPGKNCWRVERAGRVAFLVDGEAYFRAFAAAAAHARSSIVVVGWDIQAAARLAPRALPDGLPVGLGDFLQALLARRPDLQVHLLDWDFSLLFAFERELLPAVRLGWLTHPRLHFALDGEHPATASHHQKIVVIDDAIAFVGGLDLTTHRWDRPAHRVDDPDRVELDGSRYAPFHDVQIAVDGAAARALGTLARERWRRATGERLPAAPGCDPWPPDLRANVTDVDVAIARTDPPYAGREGVREVETLYLDAIAAARRSLYVESQYFTSSAIADALADRLAEPDAPEIVIVVPLTCSGWLEEGTMGVMRASLVRRLYEADRQGRLRLYYVRLAGPGCPSLNIHSKVMIVDDVLARVASSNLSNRSMGLDTECDVALEASSPRVARAIAALRDRLVAEHLGVRPAAVRRVLARSGSLIRTIETLRGGARTLEPLPLDEQGAVLPLPELPLVDLERPVAHAPFLARLLPVSLRESLVHAATRIGPVLLGLALLVVLWRWAAPAPILTPIVRSQPFVVLLAFVAGSTLFVPLVGLVTLSVLVLGTWEGALYALAGALLAAAGGWAVGRRLPQATLVRLAGRHLERVGWRLRGASVLTVATMRVLPIAPFMAVNLIAGARRVAPGRFLLGTFLGMIPVVAALAALARVVVP